MKKLSVFLILGALFTTTLFTSCFDTAVEVVNTYYGEKEDKVLKKHLNLPPYPFNYNFTLPKHTNLFAGGINSDMATLGRVLFYDNNLSKDKTISCASCHKQELAFSDDVSFSTGIENRATARNSIALGSVLNFAAYYGGSFGIPFFWDNRAESVQDQSKATFGNPLEMGMKMHEVSSVVNDLEYYEPLIEKAYGRKGNINETQVLDAIAEFINSMTNYNTKFDRELDKKGLVRINDNFPGFTESENNGKKLYLLHCSSCHGSNAGRPPVLKANNGLYLKYEDKGVATHTGNPKDVGMFKVPTLRNITRTAPYMHDGSLNTLLDVINHYSTGIKLHENLSFNGLRAPDNSPRKFNFTELEKSDLIAFLSTLNDENITQDPKFSNPFLK